MNKFEWKELTSVLLIIIVVSITTGVFYEFTNQQDKTLQEIKNVLTEVQKNKFLAHDNLQEVMQKNKAFKEYGDDIVKTSEQVNIPMEILREVKYYNQMLNEKQHDTLQFIVYILAFFSIIATFFGYKTISDIKGQAKESELELTERSKTIFDILDKTADSNMKFFDSTHKSIVEMNDKQSKETEKTLEIINQKTIKMNKVAQEVAQKLTIMSKQITDMENILDNKEIENEQREHELLEKSQRITTLQKENTQLKVQIEELKNGK